MSQPSVALIVGSGFAGLLASGQTMGNRNTPYGMASSEPLRGILNGEPVVVLARHGTPHRLAPHAVNYRANLWLLKSLGATCVLATNTVGGISSELLPGSIVIPDQVIDYTWGRQHTYMDEDRLEHVDFTAPYTARARTALIEAARADGIDVIDGGVYGATQGPRLESAAEIERMARDGCAIVGMTGMPEAGLARELDVAYAAICLVVNAAAGRSAQPISSAAMATIAAGAVAPVAAILAGAARRLEVGEIGDS